MKGSNSFEAQLASQDQLHSWRERYREAMDCQVVHDSLHTRPGWTRAWILGEQGVEVGYGAVVEAGPWTGNPTLFEFYLDAAYVHRSVQLFEVLLAASDARAIRAQSNDALLYEMVTMHTDEHTCESMLFADRRTTELVQDRVVFRAMAPADSGRIFEHRVEPPGEWLLEEAGVILATGGISFNYNPPYGDLFMEVAEDARRRGLGAFLIQELKRVCYGKGRVPVARCAIDNVASRRTLERAGFEVCGEIVTAVVRRDLLTPDR